MNDVIVADDDPVLVNMLSRGRLNDHIASSPLGRSVTWGTRKCALHVPSTATDATNSPQNSH